MRAPRAANASVCYARESVTEGMGRTRLIVRLSQCNVLARTGSTVKSGAAGAARRGASAWSRGKVKKIAQRHLKEEKKEESRATV